MYAYLQGYGQIPTSLLVTTKRLSDGLYGCFLESSDDPSFWHSFRGDRVTMMLSMTPNINGCTNKQKKRNDFVVYFIDYQCTPQITQMLQAISEMRLCVDLIKLLLGATSLLSHQSFTC